MGIVGLAGGKKRLERVVAGDHETSDVGQKLTAKVENDKEEVKRDETDDGVSLGDGGALLEVVKSGVLGQLEWRKFSVKIASEVGYRHSHPEC